MAVDYSGVMQWEILENIAHIFLYILRNIKAMASRLRLDKATHKT